MILTQAVENVGAKGEHLSVKKGFARNFLFKTNVAVYETAANTALYAADTAAIDPVARDQVRSRDRIRRRISRATLLMKRHVKDDGRLHAPVSRDNVAAKLQQHKGISVAPDDVLLVKPIGSLGPHVIPVRVGDASVDLKIRIDKR